MTREEQRELRKKQEKRRDWIGAACGVFLVLVAIGVFISGQMGTSAGVKKSQIPATAQTLTGTAPGRNGDITVTVVADENKLYQIGTEGYHPLTPAVRSEWTLEPFHWEVKQNADSEESE